VNHLIFKKLDFPDCRKAIWELVGRSDATAIVVSNKAAWLADSPQPPNRAEHRVVRLLLDLASVSDSFNPLDVLSYISPLDPEDYLSALLEPIAPPKGSNLEPAWRNLAVELFESLVGYQLHRNKRKLSLVEVTNIFFQESVVENLATLLDCEGKVMKPAVFGVISAFLQRQKREHSGILSLIQGAISILNMASVQRAVERTTFDLDAVAAGGVTIYVEAPPQVLRSYGALVRLWLSAFLHLAAARPGCEHPLLLVVDNAAGLGVFPQLRLAQHLPAGAVEVWSFWESLGQLKAASPADWSAFVGNCRSVRALGPQSPAVATELADAFGVPAADLVSQFPGHWRNLAGDLLAPGPVSPPQIRESACPPAVGHVLTFAPVRADRWSAVAAELRQRPDRSVVIVESAGVCHALTCADREAKGGKVVRLDPFGILGTPTDQFNPLDLLRVATSFGFTNALCLAEVLWPPVPTTLDRFWWQNALSLAHAVLAYLYSVPEKECSFVELKRVLSSDDVVYNLAVVLDTIGKKLPPECYCLIAAFLQKADTERVTVLTDVLQALRIFGEPHIAFTVQRSSFELRDFVGGNPLTIYIELPIMRYSSHKILVQLWISSLLRLCDHERPQQRPQFIFESPFSVGLFPLLHMAQRADVVDIWTFWESLDQIRAEHPADWSAFLANMGKVDAIGPQSPVVAADLSTQFGETVEALQTLTRGEQMTLYKYPST
jgi:type IV secretion system protein VirD4